MQEKQKFIRSFTTAGNGIKEGLKNHRNFRVLSFLAILTVITAFYFSITKLEWAIVVICIFSVLGAELLNTSIEELLDHLHPERHPKIGMAKDIAAGAVLIISIGAAITGGIIFIPYLIQLFQGNI